MKFRSSSPDLFLWKAALKICSKFTGEQPCWSVFSMCFATFVITFGTNSLTSIIEKYKQPSITAIKNHGEKIENPKFSLKKITKPTVVKEI